MSLRLRHREHGLLPGYGSAPGSDPNPLPNGATPDPNFTEHYGSAVVSKKKQMGYLAKGAG
jgi:hypothetical protein